MTQAISNFDFIVLVDFSGSMATTDAGQSANRITKVRESLTGFISELTAVDEDGIDLITFGGEQIVHTSGVKNTQALDQAFATRRVAGGTPTAEALATAFEIAGKSDKPDFVIVFTDGEPNNRESVKQVIRDQANKQNSDAELTVLFIQVGNDPDAGQFLADLDDNLNAKFDIIDTVTQAQADAFPTLAGLIEAAING